MRRYTHTHTVLNRVYHGLHNNTYKSISHAYTNPVHSSNHSSVYTYYNGYAGNRHKSVHPSLLTFSFCSVHSLWHRKIQLVPRGYNNHTSLAPCAYPMLCHRLSSYFGTEHQVLVTQYTIMTSNNNRHQTAHTPKSQSKAQTIWRTKKQWFLSFFHFTE